MATSLVSPETSQVDLTHWPSCAATAEFVAADIAVNLLVSHNTGDARRGTALLVADSHFEVVGLTVRGLGTTVGVGAVLVSHGGFEGVIAIGLCSTDADDNAVGVQQRTGDVPGHGDGAAAGGFG